MGKAANLWFVEDQINTTCGCDEREQPASYGRDAKERRIDITWDPLLFQTGDRIAPNHAEEFADSIVFKRLIDPVFGGWSKNPKGYFVCEEFIAPEGDPKSVLRT